MLMTERFNDGTKRARISVYQKDQKGGGECGTEDAEERCLRLPAKGRKLDFIRFPAAVAAVSAGLPFSCSATAQVLLHGSTKGASPISGFFALSGKQSPAS